MKKKALITAVAAAAVLAIGTAGCGSGVSAGDRDNKNERHSESESQYKEPAEGQDGKEERGEETEEDRKEEQDSNKQAGSAGQEIIGITFGTDEEEGGDLERIFAEGVGDILRREELTWFGNHISTLDYETAMASLERNGFRIEEDIYHEEEDYYSGEAHYGDDGTLVSISQEGESDRIEFIGLMNLLSGTGSAYTMEIREITLGDSMEIVLEKLGFTNADEIAAYILEKQQIVYPEILTGKDLDLVNSEVWLEQADGGSTGISATLFVKQQAGDRIVDMNGDESVQLYIGYCLPGESVTDCGIILRFDKDYILRLVYLI